MTLKKFIMEKDTVESKEPAEPTLNTEREEGEISDLDLEEISDCSLTSNQSTFKSTNTKEVKTIKSIDSLYLSCLSEDSDCEVVHFDSQSRKPDEPYYHPTRLKRGSNRKYRYKCGRKKARVDISGDKKTRRPSISDSEGDGDNSLLLKLNKAVRVNEMPETSLRARLNKMVSGDKENDSDSECELIELRKAALESKLRECIKAEKELAKIETISMLSPDHTVEHVENVEQPQEAIDDDEEKLRTEALKSAFLKKATLRRQRVTQKKPGVQTNELEEVSVQIKTVINDLLDYIISDSEQQNDETEEIEIPPMPPILDEPVNVDVKQTEDDEDILRAMVLTSVAKNINKNVPSPPSNTRISTPPPPKVDIPVQRLIINIGADSDSDSSVDTKPSVPSNFEASLSQLLKDARANADKQQDTSKMNSVIKRLPESRQKEYIQLKKRLEELSNKKDALLIQNQLTNKPTKDANLNSVKLKRSTKTLQNAMANKAMIGTKLPLTSADNKLVKKTLTVNRTEHNMAHIVNRKRFLQGKYKDLGPIVLKTKAARLERDRAGEQVKRLMEELRITRQRYNEHHETYKNCIQQYLMLKSSIAAEMPLEMPTKRPMQGTSNSKKRMTVQNTSTNEMRVMTPINDIVKVSSKSTNRRNIVPKKPNYMPPKPSEVNVKTATATSDPDKKLKRRSVDFNPLVEVCPFDLQGFCRDVDCKYRHLG